MSAQRDAARSALYESYWSTQRLEDGVEVLEDPMALAYVDVAIRALDRLDALLEAQERRERDQEARP